MQISLRFLSCFALVAAAYLAGLPLQTANSADDATAKHPPSDPFFEPVAPLTPKHVRTEAEVDSITSAALFSHGRMLLQRGHEEEALRKFQRAWRLNPEAASIFDDIIPLAYALHRPEVSARYAVIQAELNPDDPIMLRRLGQLLTSQGHLTRAIGLYEKSFISGEEPEGPQGEAKAWRELGQLYLVAGDAKQSVEAFATFLAAVENPEKSQLDAKAIDELLGRKERTYTLIAEGFLEAEQYDKAERMFRAADAADPQPARLLLNLARVDAARGKTNAALRKLNRYFAAKEASAGAAPYELLSELLAKKHKDQSDARDKLITRLEELQAEDAKNVDLLLFLAQQSLESGKLDASAEAYFAAAELLEDPRQALMGLVDVQTQRGDAEKLLAALDKLVLAEARLDPEDESLQKIAADKPLTDALLDPKLRAEVEPGETLAAAYVALAAKRYDAAQELIEAAVKQPTPPADEVLANWGLALLDEQRYEQSAAVLLRAAEATPPEEKGIQAFRFVYTSLALELAGKTDDALAKAAQALALSDSPRIQIRPAWILAHAKRLPEARSAYQALVEKHDDEHGSLETRDVVREARMMLSSVCVQLDDMPQAEEWLEQVLDEFPEDVGALNDLGYLWADQGKHLARALEMTRKAVAEEPDNVAYQDSLGWAYHRLGRHDEALVHLEKATEIEDPDGVILDHLGDAYQAAGQIAKALEAWRRAAAAFEKEEDAEMLKKTRQKIEQQKGDKPS